MEKDIKPKTKKDKNSEIVKMQKDYAELNDKFLRAMAEVKNTKRRHDEEITRIQKYESEDLIKKILDITDDFERAITLNSNVNNEIKKFLDGFEMIYASLISILTDLEVMEIKCLNEEFDPFKAQAVLTEKINDVLPGVVIDVLQKGYMYKDKVIRPAMVKVSE